MTNCSPIYQTLQKYRLSISRLNYVSILKEAINLAGPKLHPLATVVRTNCSIDTHRLKYKPINLIVIRAEPKDSVLSGNPWADDIY